MDFVLFSSGLRVRFPAMQPKCSVLWSAVVIGLLVSSGSAHETQRQYLSGKGTDDAVPWEFFCSSGGKSGQWTTIPVPSCWDVLGFGTLNYRQDAGMAEQGKYRYRFKVPQAWCGKRVLIVFDGVMTDTQVSVNGASAGEKHQGAFYRFSYDITDKLKFGDGEENLLEVRVDKKSANESVNRAERQADYWLFGGIYRPVWLESKPQRHIERVAIDAKADGTIAVDVFANSPGTQVAAWVTDRDGGPAVAPVLIGRVVSRSARLEAKVDSPRTWTAETPNLYRLDVRLLDADGEVLHRVVERFGFRTVEVRAGDGIYVNGKRVLLKGTNRHSFWPESGRALNATLSRQDVMLMKEMNCNAVRMSHYPPDEHFLDACDELGLYVLDELAGWQKSYDTPTATRLIGQMVRRDVNHPSVLFWDNANEGGWNREVDDEFAKWDPQKREVLHPWELFRKVNTRHYRSYDEHVKLCQARDIYLPTEFLHGLFDGGAGAGLAEYWEATRASKVAAGGFIWAWCDETLKRPDGKMDGAGNQAPDGVVGPYREKEGSFHAIKEIWSPIVVRQLASQYEVDNRYAFTRSGACTFSIELRAFRGPFDAEPGHVTLSGTLKRHWNVPPGGSQRFDREELSQAIPGGDAFAVRVDDPTGHELWTWVWPMNIKKGIALPGKSAELPFGRGVRAVGGGELKSAQWRESEAGWLELEYCYALDGTVDFHGVSFDLPEKDIKSIRWLGQGPFRVWKNRLQGTTLGVWEKGFDDTQTGYDGWKYPEFKGYHAGVRWMRLETSGGPIVMELENPSLFVQVGRPKFPGDPQPFSPTTAATRRAPTSQLSGNAWTLFPDAGLSILHAIPPIGSKFQLANTTGPQGQQNVAKGEYRGRVRFYVGSK